MGGITPLGTDPLHNEGKPYAKPHTRAIVLEGSRRTTAFSLCENKSLQIISPRTSSGATIGDDSLRSVLVVGNQDHRGNRQEHGDDLRLTWHRLSQHRIERGRSHWQQADDRRDERQTSSTVECGNVAHVRKQDAETTHHEPRILLRAWKIKRLPLSHGDGR